MAWLSIKFQALKIKYPNGPFNAEMNVLKIYLLFKYYSIAVQIC